VSWPVASCPEAGAGSVMSGTSSQLMCRELSAVLMAQAMKYSAHVHLISLSPWIARRRICAATGIILGQLSDRKGECMSDGN